MKTIISFFDRNLFRLYALFFWVFALVNIYSDRFWFFAIPAIFCSGIQDILTEIRKLTGNEDNENY